jgi:hypothetical protein
MSSPTRSSLYLVALIALLPVIMLVGIGCSDFEEAWNVGDDSSASQPEVTPVVGEFLEDPDGEAANPARDGNQNRAASDAGPVLAQPNVLPVHLSVGIALAQTLPNGTAMSFSVDYQFREGSPNQSNKYVWVIEGQGGKSLQKPVALANKGNLSTLAPGLRPEAGPFSSHIFEITPDGSQRKISRSISMR